VVDSRAGTLAAGAPPLSLGMQSYTSRVLMVHYFSVPTQIMLLTISGFAVPSYPLNACAMIKNSKSYKFLWHLYVNSATTLTLLANLKS